MKKSQQISELYDCLKEQNETQRDQAGTVKKYDLSGKQYFTILEALGSLEALYDEIEPLDELDDRRGDT